MTPRNPVERVHDIMSAVVMIEEHRRRGQELGLDRADPLLLDAVVHQLSVIGEAATHLPDALTERHPQIPWQGVRGMRLLLDHEYHRVDPDIVWRTVDEDLPPLALALRSEQPFEK